MFNAKIYFCLHQALIYWSTLDSSNANPLVGNKIQETKEHEFPFIVSIGMKSANGKPGHYHFCTGALISRRHVLTAEHCFGGAKLSDIQVSVGSSETDDGVKYNVDFLSTFENWAERRDEDIKFSDNDVAILRLEKEVEDPNIEPAVVSFKKSRELYTKNATTAGWGVSRNGKIPKHMEKAKLQVITYGDCMDHVKDIAGKRIIISENFLCTLTNDDALIQSGDSGGPLFIGNEIIGINGATFPENKNDNDPDVQNIHVQLYYYKDFIEDILNNYA